MNITRHQHQTHRTGFINKRVILTGFCLLLNHCLALAQTIDLRPGDSFEDAVESLQAGDTLIVHAGVYSDQGRISIHAQGTSDQPVVIKAASGEARPLITRPSDAPVQNTLNIEGAAYLTIQGLEVTGNGGDGIKVSGSPSHHIVLQDLVIHDIDVGINTKNNSHNFTIRNNHIYNTGIDQGTGEGMYIGCHEGDCSLSNSLIAHNLIHDVLPGTTQGDGIEVKFNSQNIIIRDNVIYNRPFPGIFVYGGGAPNLIEGNVVWNSLEGIAAVSDAIVRNNILFDNETGIISFHHVAVPYVANTSFIHNTLYNNQLGVLLRWENATNMVFANNAVYSPGQVAIDSHSGANAVSTNLTEGIAFDASAHINDTSYIDGRAAELDFTDLGILNFWPTSQSPLVAAADPAYAVTHDFNGQTRQFPHDIGAYQSNGQASNPGWLPSPAFKQTVPQVATPTVSTPIDNTTTVYSTSTTINHGWKTIQIPDPVSFERTPVIIAGIPTLNGFQPGVAQINNVSPGQFDIRFKEYEYLDGFHLNEQIAVMAGEPGQVQLDDGTVIEFGWFDLNTSPRWQPVSFSGAFPQAPAVFLTVQSADNDRAVMARSRNVNSSGFQAAFYQQESNQNQFISERVGYMAVYHPQSNGNLTVNTDSGSETLNFEINDNSMNHQPYTINNRSIHMQEEQSRDPERFHVTENVQTFQLGEQLFGQIASANGDDTAALRVR
ncbi:MAG: right-handed parallel beta-helix repeat-containing protein [Gammaproteobacteria bacterium]|nr:right-handed parallel beta-helix repeat-containing protein [Gammaproteobacteria bacterium]